MEDRILIHSWVNWGNGRQDTYSRLEELGSGRQDTNSQLGELGQWKTGYLLTAGLTEAVEDRILIHSWVNLAVEDRILIHGWVNLGSGRQDSYSQLGELGQWKTGYLFTAGLTEAVEDGGYLFTAEQVGPEMILLKILPVGFHCRKLLLHVRPVRQPHFRWR